MTDKDLERRLEKLEQLAKSMDQAVVQAYSSDLAHSLLIRATLGIVAKMANPGDPREFLSQIEEMVMAQIDVEKLVPQASDAQSEKIRDLVKKNLHDTLSRINWGDG